MTDQEIINVEVQTRMSSLETKFEAFMRSHEDFKQEMRQQNEMRANEIRDLQKRQDAAQAKHDADMKAAQEKHDADMKAAQEKHDADMKAAQEKHDADMKEINQRFYSKFDAMDTKIDSKFDRLGDQLHTITLAAFFGVGGIVVGVGALIYSIISR